MPFDLLPLLVVRHLTQQRQAAAARARATRQVPLASLRASPLHIVLSNPLPHPAANAPSAPAPHLLPIKVSKPIATDSGVKHPTPAEVAQQLVGKATAQANALLAQMAAKTAAYIAAHPRPSPTAQPADISTWLKAGGISPREAYPEWQWQTIRKTATPLSGLLGSISRLSGQTLETGESVAVVQLGPQDAVVWYQHPTGAWSYYHHWSQDIGSFLQSVGNSILNAATSAGKALNSVVSDVTSIVGTILQYAQIAASFVPGLGQVVNEVVSVAEAAIDALGGESALAIAFDTAYHAILASVPGLESLAPLVGPMVTFLKNLIGQKNVEAAAVHTALGAALKQVPDSPSVGGYSPRSLAASLAGWVLSKLHIPS